MNSLQLWGIKVKVRLLQMLRTNAHAAKMMGTWYSMRGHQIILFTKLHPIYSDFAYSNQLKGYKYLYFDTAWTSSNSGKALLQMAKVLHVDAVNVAEAVLNFKGKILVECEGAAQEHWFNHPRIAHIIFQSHYAASRSAHVGVGRVIYPGVRVPNSLRPWNTKSKTITLLTVGYGCLIKGYDVSFAIFQQLKQKGYNVRLIIAGKSEHNFSLYPEGTQAAFDAGNYTAIEDYGVMFDDLTIRPFYRSELFNHIYPGSFLLLHFARMETFGYTILEAMSYGVPVIGVKFKAIPEMVEHGVNGYLCNPFNWDGVSEIEEMKMNEPAWASQCISEGLAYVEKLVEDKPLHQSMRMAAYEKSKQFSVAKRAALLAPLLKN